MIGVTKFGREIFVRDFMLLEDVTDHLLASVGLWQAALSRPPSFPQDSWSLE